MTEKLGATELRERAEALARGQAPASVLSAVISMLKIAEDDAGGAREAVAAAGAAAEVAFNAVVAGSFPTPPP